MSTFTKIAADLAIKTAGEFTDDLGEYVTNDGIRINTKGKYIANEDGSVRPKTWVDKAKETGSNAWDKVKEIGKSSWGKVKGAGSSVYGAAKKHPIIAALTALGVPGLAAGGYYLTHRDKGDDE